MPAQATDKKREELREQYPNAWIPVAEGDKLEGKVVDVTRAWSDARARNGDGWYPLIQVETDEGNTLGFHAFSAVAYNRVMDHQPVPGERIVVTYTGEGKAKPGQNAAKLFTIVMPGRDPRIHAKNVYSQLGARQPSTGVAQSDLGEAAPEQEDFDF